MARAKGTYGTLDNWVLRLAPRLPVGAGWVLIALENQSNYSTKTLTQAELCEATGREILQVRRAVNLLTEYGLAVKIGRGQYAIGNPARAGELVASLTSLKEKAIQARSKGRLKESTKEPLKELLKESIKEFLKEQNEVVLDASGTEKTYDPQGLEGLEGLEASEEDTEQDGQTAGGQAENETEYGAAPEFDSTPDLLSQEKPETVNLEGEAEAGLSPSLSPVPQPPFPSPVAPSAADAAALLFHDLAGYNFVSSHRASLERWSAAYSPAFLRLAYRLAPGLAGVRVGQHAFAWLLNREREWPEELKAQYQRDLQPAVSGPLTIIVQPGDVLRWPDGRTATVERVDNADAVTDAPDDERGYVPLAVIGRSVQVVRA